MGILFIFSVYCLYFQIKVAKLEVGETQISNRIIYHIFVMASDLKTILRDLQSVTQSIRDMDHGIPEIDILSDEISDLLIELENQLDEEETDTANESQSENVNKIGG